MDSGKAMQQYLPPLMQRGMVELVGSTKSLMMISMLIAAPAATSLAVTFADEDGNPFQFADASWVAQPHAEGTIVEIDESTKTANGCTLLSKDYAGAGTNFLNSINLLAVGRGSNQPITQEGQRVAP